MNSRTNTDAQIYRDAARLLEKASRHDYACEAVAKVTDYCGEWNRQRLALRMKRAFRPRCESSAWLSVDGANEHEERGVRILALCFMAAMVEAGDA